MSDFNSSLPVRTENAGDIIAKIADATTPSQQLAVDSSGRVTVKLDDGAGNSVTSQANGGQRALDVGINVSGVQVDPRAIRALTSSDVVTVDQGTSPWVTSDLADGSVSGGTAGTKSLLAGLVFNTSLPTLTNGQQAAAQADSSGRLIIAPLTNSSIVKAQLQDNSGSAITLGQKTMSSSVPVVIASDQTAIPVSISAASGNNVNDYSTASAVAGGATSNHDYIVTAGKTFNGDHIWATASGKLKIEVRISIDGGTTFTTKWVGFNSTANPNIEIPVGVLKVVDSGPGAVVRIIRTNKDGSLQDLYSTISGIET